MMTTISNSTSVKARLVPTGIGHESSLRMENIEYRNSAAPHGREASSTSRAGHLSPPGRRLRIPAGCSPGTTPSQGSAASTCVYTQAEPT